MSQHMIIECPNCGQTNIKVRWTEEVWTASLPQTNDRSILVEAENRIEQDDFTLVCEDCSYEWRDKRYRFINKSRNK